MLDLLSVVPYYTGHLASALGARDDVRLRVAAITYHLDRGYYSRQHFKLSPGLNVVSQFNIRTAALRQILKLLEYLFNLGGLVSRILVARPDLIHVQFLPLLAWGIRVELEFIRMVKRLGIPIVYTVHNILPQSTGESRRSIYRDLYPLPDALICHDYAARERLVEEFSVDRRRIAVIPHGPLFTQNADFAPLSARKALGIPDDQVFVLWQGILRPYKGVSFLLKAWHQIQCRASTARLAIVGTADRVSMRAVEEEVQRLAIGESVRLDFRFVPEREITLFYSAADVLVYPYCEITTSGALMTGLAYGKAIVTTRLEAFQSVLTEGRDALMVEYGDVKGLADTLLRLIAQPALRDELGAAARKTCGRSQQWPEIAASTSALYQTVAQDVIHAR